VRGDCSTFASVHATYKTNPMPSHPKHTHTHTHTDQEFEFSLNEITPEGARAVAAALAGKKHLTK